MNKPEKYHEYTESRLYRTFIIGLLAASGAVAACNTSTKADDNTDGGTPDALIDITPVDTGYRGSPGPDAGLDDIGSSVSSDSSDDAFPEDIEGLTEPETDTVEMEVELEEDVAETNEDIVEVGLDATSEEVIDDEDIDAVIGPELDVEPDVKPDDLETTDVELDTESYLESDSDTVEPSDGEMGEVETKEVDILPPEPEIGEITIDTNAGPIPGEILSGGFVYPGIVEVSNGDEFEITLEALNAPSNDYLPGTVDPENGEISEDGIINFNYTSGNGGGVKILLTLTVTGEGGVATSTKEIELL